MNRSSPDTKCLALTCVVSSVVICLMAVICGAGVLLGLSLRVPDDETAQIERVESPTIPLAIEVPSEDIPVVVEGVASTSVINGPLRVHFIDVDQGDSILIIAPDGATALIDGGYDNGMALAYLQQQGITHIDVMIATHPHADHIGGLVQVMQAMSVGEIWTNGAIHTTSIFESFIDTIADQKIPYHEAEVGTTVQAGDLELKALYSKPNAADLNDTSLVLHLSYGTISFLFTGDAEYAAEMEMLQTVADQLPAQILKVGHHGSYTSSSPAFLTAVQPEVAIYSAGRNNDYGHPHQETITNLINAGATIYGTDVHGTVVVETDGSRYLVYPALDTPAIAGGNLQPAVTNPATVLPQPPVVGFPSATLRYDPNGPDRDCGNFATHAEAQAFFIAAGGPEEDPHGLDRDNDGIACESLP
ncbi:MAG: MBL fold metallo-hydrolase [Anaerolineae bacterium]|nr:MBL fold metallo-hydrolase [Anaerolineae bacterium]